MGCTHRPIRCGRNHFAKSRKQKKIKPVPLAFSLQAVENPTVYFKVGYATHVLNSKEI